MRAGYSEQQFEEIEEDLDHALRWFRQALGPSVEESRLIAIRDKLREIQAILADDKRRARIFDLVDEVVAYHAWVDAIGFVRIWRAFSRLKDHQIPRRLLRRAMQGPLSPQEEDLPDSDARNVFAQLEMAADLSLSGIELLSFEDLGFRFRDCYFVAECKRLWSQRRDTVKRNIQTAAQQITQALDALDEPLSRGLVAVEVGKISGVNLTRPTEFPVFRSGDAAGYARKITEAFLSYYDRLLVGLDSRIIAVFVIARFVVQTLPENSFGPVYIPTIVPLVKKSTRDRRRLERLQEHLSPDQIT